MPDHARTPSDKAVGFLFVVVALVLAAFGFVTGWAPGLIAALVLTAVALGWVAAVRPHALRPLNTAWTWLGQTLGKVVSPLVLGILYFGVLTPIALIGRACGRDELKLKRRAVSSYWVERDPPGPAASSFKQQF